MKRQLIPNGTVLIVSYPTDRPNEDYSADSGLNHYETNVHWLREVFWDAEGEPSYEFEGSFTPYGESELFIPTSHLKKILETGVMHWDNGIGTAGIMTEIVGSTVMIVVPKEIRGAIADGHSCYPNPKIIRRAVVALGDEDDKYPD